ncbi:MAG: oligosaccharide flippase family protein [Ruminococcus sp.]|nr:oligosaccharide flippase family protein [Ruminococcus sp.]
MLEVKQLVNQKKAGVILSYISEVIKILSSLIYTPIMLRLLGQSEYGTYQIVYSVVSYLSLLSLGFTASYVRYFSRYKVQEKDDDIAKLNGMFMTIFLIISAICLLCGSVMVINIKSIFSDGLTENEYSIARTLMIMMVINLAITFPNSVFDCFTAAHERFFFQRLLTVLQNLLNPFLTLPLLIMGYGSVGMVAVTTLLTVSKLISNIWFSFKKLHVHFQFKGFDVSLLKEIWAFTFFIFLNQIIDQINWSVDKFLLGRMIGTTATAVYGLGGQINTMYVQLSSSVSSVFVPKVNRIVADTNDNTMLSKLFSRIGRIQFIILSLVLSGFIFFGEPFMHFWGGAGYEASYGIALWLIIPVTVPLIQNLGIEIQRAKNMHKVRSVVYFFIAIGNIFLSIPLIKLYGAIGAAMGTAISLTAGNILFMNWYYNYKIGLDIPAFWKNILKFIPALIFPVICGTLIMILVEINSVMKLFVFAFIYFICFSLSMWFIGMNDDEKQMIMKPIQKLLQMLIRKVRKNADK